MPQTAPPTLSQIIEVAATVMANLIPETVETDLDLGPLRFAFIDAGLDRGHVVAEAVLKQPDVQAYLPEAITPGQVDRPLDQTVVAEAADELVADLLSRSPEWTRDPSLCRIAIAVALAGLWKHRERQVRRVLRDLHRRRTFN